MPDDKQKKRAPFEGPFHISEKIGPYEFRQDDKGHKLTVDSLLLAEFMLPLRSDDRVIDLGTGAGVIPLVLAWRSDVRSITGVEVSERAFALAEKNIEANNLTSRVSLLRADYRDLKGLLKERSFSVVLSNPPYTKANTGRVSPVWERAVARSEILGGLVDLIGAADYLLTEEGRVGFVFPTLRLEEMMKALEQAGLKARRLCFVHPAKGKPSHIFLIEAGRSGELTEEEPIFLDSHI